MSKRLNLFLILIVIKLINSINETTLLTIIRTNFVKGLLIVFNSQSANDTLFIQLHKSGYSLVVFDRNMTLEIDYTLSGYLFLGFEKELVNDIILRPGAIYLFYFDDCLDCDEIVELLHNVNVFNIHFIVNNKYFIPVRDNNCNYVLIEKDIQLRLKSPTWNFYGCVVNVLAREWPPNIMSMTYHDNVTLLSNFSDGIEVRLVRLIADKLNYTINYYSKITGAPLEYQYILLENPQYDMLTLSNIPSLESHTNFSYTIPVVADALMWNCPTSPKIPETQVLLTIFDKDLWFGIGLWFCIIIITMCIFLKIKGKFNLGYAILQTILVHLGLPLMPSKGPDRTLLLWASMYGLIVATAYQSGIISALTSIITPYQPQTIREIIDEGKIKFGMIIGARRFMTDPDDDYKHILKTGYICESIISCLRNGIPPRNHCVLANQKLVEHLAPSLFLDKEGHTIYYELKNVLLPYYAEVLMRKNHILIEPFDYYIGELLAGGFIQKWSEDLKLLPSPIITEDAEKLNIGDFEGPLLLLVLGYSLSLCVFVIEFLLICMKYIMR